MAAAVLLFTLGNGLGCGSKTAPLYQLAWDNFAILPPGAAAEPTRIAVAPGASADTKFAALVDFFKTELAETRVPGAAFAIVLDGRIAYEEGLGVARARSNIPVDHTTLFRIGSTTKLITACALMTLKASGKVDLDAPLATYAPWFTRRSAAAAASVTLRGALSHAAAIPDDNVVNCATDPQFRIRDYFTARAAEPIWAPAGAVFAYSNAGYDLVGGVIEQVTGERFDDYVTRTVLQPADMQRATFDPAVMRAANHAEGHDVSGRLLENSVLDDCAWNHPAGISMSASVDDMAHLMENLLAGEALLDRASIAELQTDRIETRWRPEQHYGFGLFTMPYHGVRVLSHPGNVPGFSAFFALVPERQFAVVALVNADSALPAKALAAIDLFLDLPAEPPPNRYTDPATWTAYVGTYDDPAGMLGQFTIALDGDRLTMTPLGEQSDPTWLTGTFWRGSNGFADYLVTRRGIARRMP